MVTVNTILVYVYFFFTQALRELVFGTATGPSFNADWRRQNFEFCDVPKLEYGLVQHKV